MAHLLAQLSGFNINPRVALSDHLLRSNHSPPETTGRGRKKSDEVGAWQAYKYTDKEAFKARTPPSFHDGFVPVHCTRDISAAL